MTNDIEESPVEQAMSEPPKPAESSTKSNYEFVADKIGFVPNARKSDNVWQAKFIGVSIAIGATLGSGIGHIFFGEQYDWLIGLLFGLLASLIVGVLVSGTILAIRRLKD